MALKYLTNLKLAAHLSKANRKLPYLSPLLSWSISSSSFCFIRATAALSPNEGGILKEQRLSSLLKQCLTKKGLEQLHAQTIQLGLGQDPFLVGKMIVFCAVSEHDLMDYAVSVFETIENPDGFLWNTMIRGFANEGLPGTALEYYRRMLGRGELADNFTFSFLLKVCGQLGSPVLGRQIHCIALKHGLESHVFVRNTLIHMYGMLRDVETATHLFEEISRSDLVAWNTIIDCHVGCGKWKEALDLFLRMLRSGIQPDEATLVVTLSACSALGALDFGKWVHSLVNDTGHGHVFSVSNSLIDMYAKCGAVQEAFHTFNRMNGRNVVSWNTMIQGLAMHGHVSEALGLFRKMLKENVGVPNDVTFLGVLCACNHGGLVEEGRRYFDSMIKEYHIQPTIKHYGCMVDILGRAGLVVEAYRLIKSMPMECNAVVWRSLLAACRLHEKVELGELVRMHLMEMEPDYSSDYVLIANTYAGLGEYHKAGKSRKSMQVRGVQKPEPGNSLVAAYPYLKVEGAASCNFP